jgi:hypothetical protein
MVNVVGKIYASGLPQGQFKQASHAGSGCPLSCSYRLSATYDMELDRSSKAASCLKPVEHRPHLRPGGFLNRRRLIGNDAPDATPAIGAQQ